MSTRSGRNYQPTEQMESGNWSDRVEEIEVGVTGGHSGTSQLHLEVSNQEENPQGERMSSRRPGGSQEESSGNFELSKMMELLWQDRERREAQQHEDRQRWEEERLRREAEHEQHVRQMQLQLDMMKNLMERSQVREDEFARRARGGPDQLKLTKLTDTENIEAYLTTFERMMQVYEVEEARWAFLLAPQLTGKAQQAYAALKAEDATKYSEVKAAILRRYNINEETYRQRFRAAGRKEGESYTELVIRLQDLFKKWTVECKTVEEVSEKIVIEQLLSTKPSDLRIWIRERKPVSGAEAGSLADNYLQARKKESGVGQKSSQEGSQRGKGITSETRKCHVCGEVGHIAPNCPKKNATKEGVAKG